MKILNFEKNQDIKSKTEQWLVDTLNLLGFYPILKQRKTPSYQSTIGLFVTIYCSF